MFVDISQETKKWEAKVEIKSMDAKKRDILLKWRANYKAKEVDGSYKIYVSTINKKVSTIWIVVAILLILCCQLC